MNEIVWSCLSFLGHIYRLSNRRANIRGLRNPPPRRFQMAHGRKPQILARSEIRWNLFVRYGLEKTGMTSPYAGSVYFTPLGCIKAGPSGPGFLLAVIVTARSHFEKICLRKVNPRNVVRGNEAGPKSGHGGDLNINSRNHSDILFARILFLGI